VGGNPLRTTAVPYLSVAASLGFKPRAKALARQTLSDLRRRRIYIRQRNREQRSIRLKRIQSLPSSEI
jgi:hypothetical protein